MFVFACGGSMKKNSLKVCDRFKTLYKIEVTAIDDVLYIILF